MKTLHIFRHAKSSWNDPLLSDKERPLKKRGAKDAVLIALASAQTGWADAPVYSSSAVRARQTITEILDAMGANGSAVEYCDELYTFDYRQLLDWLTQRSEDELTIVGHNPALHELIEWYSGTTLSKFPTCAYCQLEIDVANWRAFSHTKGAIKALIFPKMLKNA
jgi:phosphohistidine phosphatase